MRKMKKNQNYQLKDLVHRLLLVTCYLHQLEDWEKPRKLCSTTNTQHPEANSYDIAQAQTLQAHLNKYPKARKLRGWHILVKETVCAISSGTDLAPQIYSLQAEALVKLVTKMLIPH
ncbi:hypothetical protein HHK36_004035 [Tetracentron sinense]|uniref:Uncharacterized protein n=1 Tax=Tetracentron sinense TaxID=13715 RepID=A0A835DPP1_TETSI|nr:hypothetical protein HHK36_004035 [Tetracentron sinense]